MDGTSAILSDIDAGRLQPRTHAVARHLAALEQYSGPLAAKVLAEFDAGKSAANQHLLAELWAQIESLPASRQGPLRTLVALLRPDEPVDWQLAEYLITWAEEAGVSSVAIEAAFRRS